MRSCWPAHPVASGVRFPRHLIKAGGKRVFARLSGKSYGEPQLGRDAQYPIAAPVIGINPPDIAQQLGICCISGKGRAARQLRPAQAVRGSEVLCSIIPANLDFGHQAAWQSA